MVIERIIELTQKSGRLERDITDYLGLKRGTFTNWKRGQSDSYLHYLKEISEYFHVTPNYLILGENGFTIKNTEDFYTAEEIDVIRSYRKAGVKEKNYIKALLKSIEEQN